MKRRQGLPFLPLWRKGWHLKQRLQPPSLTSQLLAYVLGGLLVVWVSLVVIATETGRHEADELTDGHLASTAFLQLEQWQRFASQGVLLLPPPANSLETAAAPLAAFSPTAVPLLKNHDYQHSISVVVWNAKGQVLQRAGEAPLLTFDAQSNGFETLQLGEPAMSWRIFTRWSATPDGSFKVAVLLNIHERDALADDIAEQITKPIYWLLPVVALVLGLAIRQGLQPLYALAKDVDALEIHQPAQPSGLLLQPHPHTEFAAVVRSINTLSSRYRQALTNERELADELAHELRTPLAAIALTARSLQHSPAGTNAANHLAQQLEQSTLAAGQVMAELLALARTSRTALAEDRQRVDMVALASSELSQCAQTAFISGHELELQSPGPFLLSGHPVLLALALRNLLENALSHTPRGTQVMVTLNPQQRWLQVCDSASAPALASPASARSESAPGPALRLKLGHRVVAKIAQVHGATFTTVPLHEGSNSCHCYRLTFPAECALPSV